MIKAAAPDVLVGPIDVRSNVLKTHVMDGLEPHVAGLRRMDAYDGIFPRIPIGFIALLNPPPTTP